MTNRQGNPPTGTAGRARLLAAFITLPAVFGAAVAVVPAYAAGSSVNEVIETWDELPSDFSLNVTLPERVNIVDADGNQYATFYTQDRTPVTVDDISVHVFNALIATEDSRFYDHDGIDPEGIARALVTNTLTGSREGGSTITQQLVENLRVASAVTEAEQESARGVTPVDKVQEMKYALGLEDAHTKDEILVAYLNTVFFGEHAYGIASAAHRYFNTTPDQLTATQAATIVGMVKSPTNYNPFRNPDDAKNRRDTVLWRMLDEGMITQDEFDTYTNEPLNLSAGTVESGCDDSDYPYYCSVVVDELLTNPAFGPDREAREANFRMGGFTVQTALNADMMEAADDAVEATLGNGNEYKTGVAIIEPGTGKVVAVAQNTEYGTGDGQTEVVYATARQQTGSSFKPVTLAAAFMEGIEPGLTMSGNSPYFSSLDNPPSGFKNAYAGPAGMLNAYEATRVSNNIYFVRLIERVGVIDTATMGNRLGLSLPAGSLTGVEASLTLGAYESSPMEVASAYATFASGGIACEPHTITRVVNDRTGKERPAPDPACERVLTAAVADTVTDILRGPFQDGGTAEGNDPGRPAAGKTGSTNDWSVAWFAGYTADYVSALWVADPDGAFANPLRNVRLSGRTVPIGYGGSVAAPVWDAIMTGVHAGMPSRDLPVHASGPVVAPVRVEPDLVGLTVEAAVTAATAAGYGVTISSSMAPAANVGPGTVIRQSLDEQSGTIFVTVTQGTKLGDLPGSSFTVTEDGVVVSAPDGVTSEGVG